MKIFESFLDGFTEMISKFFDFGEKKCILANEDVQRSYRKLMNEERFLNVLMYLIIEICKAFKALLVIGFFILIGALLTGIYHLLVRLYGAITR